MFSPVTGTFKIIVNKTFQLVMRLSPLDYFHHSGTNGLSKMGMGIPMCKNA